MAFGYTTPLAGALRSFRFHMDGTLLTAAIIRMDFTTAVTAALFLGRRSAGRALEWEPEAAAVRAAGPAAVWEAEVRRAFPQVPVQPIQSAMVPLGDGTLVLMCTALAPHRGA